MKSRCLMFLTMLVMAQAAMAGSPQIWIGFRHDGKKGRGTAKDPYDGSSQEKFDRILRGYWWRGTKNLTVNLLPGTFSTVGNGDYVPGLTQGKEGWRCNSGWIIKGAGEESTVLKLVKLYPSSNGKTFSALGIATSDSGTVNVTVQDLTVNCNHDVMGSKQSCETGIALGGSGHTIQRVTVRNASGWAGETFPIAIGANGVNSSSNIIQNCTITDWKGGAGGSITISNNVNNLIEPYTFTTGIVRNNRVVGATIGYGGWGMKGVVFSDNTAENCGYGVNIDSVKNLNVTFTNNRFIKCQGYGMVMGNCQGFKITNNVIDLAKGAASLIFLQNDGNFVITGNTFTATDPKACLAFGKDPTLFGKFVFSGNSTSMTGGIKLPAALVQEKK